MLMRTASQADSRQPAATVTESSIATSNRETMFQTGTDGVRSGLSALPMTEPLCLDDLDDGALDELPFGVIRLGPTYLVERYNRAEAERAGIQRWRAIGRDFFLDMAGTNAAELAAHVDALPRGGRARVFHTFIGYHRTDDVVIDMSRCEAGRVYLVISRAT